MWLRCSLAYFLKLAGFSSEEVFGLASLEFLFPSSDAGFPFL